MNGYKKWPANIKLPSNVEYILAPGPLDKGSQGKLHWLDDEPGYYMTVDDDIYYPKDYVAKHVKGSEKYRNLAITSFHGQRFMIGHMAPAPLVKEEQGARSMYRYNQTIMVDTPVHMVGNGLMCCVPSIIGLTRDAVRGPKHSGDDEDIAIFAQIHKVPMVVLNHFRTWIGQDCDICEVDASYRNNDFLRKQNEKLQTWRSWQIYRVDMAR